MHKEDRSQSQPKQIIAQTKKIIASLSKVLLKRIDESEIKLIGGIQKLRTLVQQDKIRQNLSIMKKGSHPLGQEQTIVQQNSNSQLAESKLQSKLKSVLDAKCKQEIILNSEKPKVFDILQEYLKQQKISDTSFVVKQVTNFFKKLNTDPSQFQQTAPDSKLKLNLSIEIQNQSAVVYQEENSNQSRESQNLSPIQQSGETNNNQYWELKNIQDRSNSSDNDSEVFSESDSWNSQIDRQNQMELENIQDQSNSSDNDSEVFSESDSWNSQVDHKNAIELQQTLPKKDWYRMFSFCPDFQQ